MDIKNIFAKLNFVEQRQLNLYINKEITKANLVMSNELEKAVIKNENDLKELNDNTWGKIAAWTDVACRENGISRARTDKIGQRVIDIANSALQEQKEEKLLIERLYKNYAILTYDELLELIEWSLEGKCKECNGKTKCSIRNFYKQFNIPGISDDKLCGYKYKKINGRVE